LKRVLLLCDRPFWAYDAIARALVKYNDDPELELDVAYVKPADPDLERRARESDAVFVLGWQLLGELRPRPLAGMLPRRLRSGVRRRLRFLDPARTLTGIHSHHAWDERRSQPDFTPEPPPALVRLLQRQRGVNAVSRRLADAFASAGVDVCYTPNGVDTELFRPTPREARDGPLVVGYSGSLKHDWRKGITELIRPACDVPGVELRLAMPDGENLLPPERMPEFYNGLDAYVCASSSEGFSLSVLEAAACGVPVISTRVGGCEDLIEDGVNGFLVDRDVGAIRERIRFLAGSRGKCAELGVRAREIVERDWSWTRRTPAWLDFIRATLAGRGTLRTE
jgi:glycosyltransferase involved in cell wall biosynthesis